MTERLSVIAGSGALVPEVIEAARQQGYAIQVLSLRRLGAPRGLPVVPFDLSRPQAALDAVRAFGATMLTMVGGLRLSDRNREDLLRMAGGGAHSVGDTALSALSGYFAAQTGARLVGAHEIAPALLAPEGQVAGPPASAELLEAAAFAIGMARSAGHLDLGQSIVLSGRRVVALEDVAGTDALLARVRRYRRQGLIADGRSPLVLAKTAKPDQPHVVDLPAIGPVTIRRARSAGIAIVAVEAGATLLIDRNGIAAAATASRIPVVGIVPRYV